jgi:hypothetical protein
MNTHIRFDDDCAPITRAPCTPTPTEDNQRPPVVTPVVAAGPHRDESDSDYDKSIGSDAFSNYTGSDDEEVEKIRTHRSSSHRFRQHVDMTLFESLRTHLEVLIEIPPAETTTLIGRVAEFIGWVMHTKTISQTDALDVIFVEDPMIILQYITMLKGELMLKNGTIYNTLLDFTRWAQYLEVYERRSIARFIGVVVPRQKAESKKKKSDIQHRLSRSNLIKHRQWPRGGMAELHQLLRKHQKRVDHIMNQCAKGQRVAINDSTFVNDWIITSLFVDNPQGRSQAITRFPLADIVNLESGHSCSTEFKTRSTYGSQSINCNSFTFQYLEAYAKHIRPGMIDSEKPSETLFLNQRGQQHHDIGVCVTRFFETVHPYYHITTTTLRSMFETEVAEATDTGILTAAERDAVIRNSGHSSTTAHMHYLKRKAEDAGRSTMSTHAKLYGTVQHTPVIQSDGDEWYDTHADITAGITNDYNEDIQSRQRRRRLNWTGSELHHLMTWVSDYESKYGTHVCKNWRACCGAMRSTEVFHELHLTTSSLRDAWRRELKKLEQK